MTATTLTGEEFFRKVGDILEPVLDWYQPNQHLENILADVVADVLELKKFVRRVYEECEYDIEIGKKCSALEVPSDLCIWDFYKEAKKLIDG